MSLTIRTSRKPRVLLALLAALLCFAVTNLVLASTAHAAGGTEITNGYNGKCLDADTGTIGQNGTYVQLWDCSDPYNPNANQAWYTQNCDFWGNCEIVNAASGRCLDADAPGVNNNGDKVQLWDCWNGANQRWSTNNGHFVNQASGKCLDADLGGINNNGDKVQLWDCWNGANQNWYWSFV